MGFGVRVRGAGVFSVVLGAIAACSAKDMRLGRAGGTDSVAYGGAGNAAGVGGVGGVSGAGASPAGIGGLAGVGVGAASGSAGTGAFGGSAGVSDAGDADGDAAVCETITHHVAPVPRDLFILLDRSASMLSPSGRWSALVSAIRDFVTAPENSGAGVGIGYFGFHPNGVPADPNLPGSCSPSDYTEPDVPIDDLLPNGRQAMLDSLGRTQPGGAAPTQPALQGALQYVAGWAAAHPQRRVAVVLATDSEPSGCTGHDYTTLSQVAAAGASGVPPIETFVIGIANAFWLNEVAVAGGTRQAFAMADADLSRRFYTALRQISTGRSALSCELTLPQPPAPVDFAQVNVFHTPLAGARRIIHAVNDVTECRPDTGGWYYVLGGLDIPIAIELCPVSCDAVTNDGGDMDIVLGCASIPPPP